MNRMQTFRSVAWVGALLACAAAYGQPARQVVPSGSVVKVTLHDPLRSKEARVGDRARPGRSG